MATAPAPSSVVEMGSLYRLSMLSDQLRDTAKLLLQHDELTADAVAQMRKRYGRLRTALTATVTSQEAADLLSWAPELDESATGGALLDAAATLSTFVDALLGAPAFVVNRRLQDQKIQTAVAGLDNAPAADADSGPRGGQYL